MLTFLSSCLSYRLRRTQQGTIASCEGLSFKVLPSVVQADALAAANKTGRPWWMQIDPAFEGIGES